MSIHVTIRLPDFIHAKLAPRQKEPGWKRLARRITCTLEGHPEASRDEGEDEETDVAYCDWCGARWSTKRPEAVDPLRARPPLLPQVDPETVEGRQEMLDRMAKLTEELLKGIRAYALDTSPFTHFTALMREYIRLCWKAERTGNTWWPYSSNELPLNGERVYLNEKLGMLFGVVLAEGRVHVKMTEIPLDPTRQP